MPELIRRVDGALCLPHLAHAQRDNIASIGERIGLRFRAIQVAVDSDTSYEQLIASMDRLREEIATSDHTLDRLLLPRI
jgi:hypothetical protein